MTRWILSDALAVVLFAGVGLVAAATAEPLAEPIIRSTLEPAGDVVLGQPVTLRVEVFVPTWFRSAPAFPEIELDDALTIFDPSAGSNLNERIEGVSYAGQMRQYAIYPQRTGRYDIPELDVRLTWASPADGSELEATLSTAALEFVASRPEAARDLDPFIATPRLAIDQEFDRDLADLKVGDAFERTVTVHVDQALSMVIPPFLSEREGAAAGLASYPAPPRLEDADAERGLGVSGQRRESVSYVAEAEGNYVLPEVRLRWWNVESRAIETSTLPAVEIEVRANPDLAEALPLPPGGGGPGSVFGAGASDRVQQLVRLALLLMVLAAVAYWVRAPIRSGVAGLRARVAAARERWESSETRAFQRFWMAARRGEAATAWRLLTTWLDREYTGEGAATVRGFAGESARPELERETEQLDETLFGRDADSASAWSGRRLAREAARARRQRGAGDRADAAEARLGPLNPSGR